MRREPVKENRRLNQYLAACGLCSRREADRLIEAGAVSVNGRPAMMGMRITGADAVSVHGKPVAGENNKVALAWYKPAGIVCTERDMHAGRLIKDVLTYPVRLTYAGRLDKDSEGLLLMTNDGVLIDAMMRGSNRHEKEYLVRVDREITDEFLRDMARGVWLKELELTTRACEIRQSSKYTFVIILTQGVNRQIRRMCAALGYQVTALKRTRVMNIRLADLKPGEYREITGGELRELYSGCGLS